MRKEGDVAVMYPFAEGFGLHYIFFFRKDVIMTIGEKIRTAGE